MNKNVKLKAAICQHYMAATRFFGLSCSYMAIFISVPALNSFPINKNVKLKAAICQYYMASTRFFGLYWSYRAIFILVLASNQAAMKKKNLEMNKNVKLKAAIGQHCCYMAATRLSSLRLILELQGYIYINAGF